MKSKTQKSDKCLQCGETPASIKANNYICGVVSGGEYNELLYDWPKHRWAPWGDKLLKYAGVKQEAYSKYRLTNIQTLQYVSCEDLVRGHILATEPSDLDDFGTRIGQCISCGGTPEV